MQKYLLLSQEDRKKACRYYSKNLRHIRKLHGLKQSELADAVGTTQRHISEIENGKAKVSWTLMLALSIVLLVDLQIPVDGGKQSNKSMELGGKSI